jgi:hypothetical protein
MYFTNWQRPQKRSVRTVRAFGPTTVEQTSSVTCFVVCTTLLHHHPPTVGD